jgi:pimeloyl-ACP methyl ester carboxylesterase
MPSLGRALLAVGAVTAALIAGAANPATAAPKIDHTSALERRRVDSVPTPRLDWYDCYTGAQCTTVRLPLDYDEPAGPTTEVALVRVRARDPQHRIGSMFVNPGGPGGSAVQLALAAPGVFTDRILDRFDIVGVDPRGVGAGDNLRCWPTVREQTAVLSKLDQWFPYGPAEEKSVIGAVRQFGRACSTTGRPLSGSVSTAEVVRDMDVLRRAVGDRKLTFYGFSYGSVIGQYYANMFPDRVRAIVADGVIDPEHWVGTAQTQGVPQDERLQSAAGSYRALTELLRRCAAAGPERCVFAHGDPVANFETIAERLRQEPLVTEDQTITYADFVGTVLNYLYQTYAGDAVTSFAEQLWEGLFPSTAATPGKGRDFPYDNGFEAYAGPQCTDGLHPADAALWPALADAADEQAPYFGREWAWASAQCARDTWTVRDEDAYTGPWNRRTAAPVLFVASEWDPATNYDDAVSAQKRLPNSRLFTNDNWGHTSYRTSQCNADATEAYIVDLTLPPAGLVCVGFDQPFTTPPDSKAATASSRPWVFGPGH